MNILRKSKGLTALLKNPKLRYGGYASVITFTVVVAAIVVNLLVAQLDLQIDMTENNVYTLSEQTRGIVDELDEQVTFYVLARRNEEPAQVMEALGRYEQASPWIRIETIDADANPGFVAQYDPDGEGLGNGSVIVATEDNYRPIGILDLYSIDDRNPQAPVIMGLNVERRVTNALIYVATGKTPIIYQTTGRGEAPVEQIGDLAANLAAENYEIRSLNLIQAPQVPEDGAVLLMFGIRSDISEGEAQKIRDFLESGGRAVFMVDVLLEELPVLNDLLSGYGLRLSQGVVIEGNQNYHTGNEFQLVPDLTAHSITESLIEARSPIMMPYGRPIEILPQKPRGVTIEPLAQTSGDSFVRVNLENQDSARSAGDIPGPFITAVAAIDTEFASSEEISRIVVIGNARFLGPIYPFGYIPGNLDFILNAIGWVQNQQETLSIRAKFTLQFPMQLTGIQVLIFAGLFVVVIPLGILITGLVIWLRRRHL
ncbi:MAG: GldG family protein [Spirochaetales bacterium]|nr:GldG family protein [Spirochaetales bacterium]